MNEFGLETYSKIAVTQIASIRVGNVPGADARNMNLGGNLRPNMKTL